MKITGNKGEWSEFYAFVKLLSTGKLYAADEKANRINDIFFPVLKIFRSEDKGLNMEYIICSKDGSVEVHWRDDVIRKLSQSSLIKIAAYLYRSIIAGGNRAFEIEDSDKIMDQLSCSKIVAPSTDKTDITMQLHDIYTGYESVCGFSIKSELGSSPTLLNASGATNFVFEVAGLDDKQAEIVNAINTDTKIIDRIEKIYEYGASLEYRKTKSINFAGNLMLIDTYMDNLVASLLLDYYRNNAQDCNTLIARLESSNPLNYPRKGMYEYKFKKFLCSVALGMMPSKVWDGHDEANGGYVIVKRNGDVLAYHIYNRDAFETYLLNNTKFERGSTTRHGFATIYKESDGRMYINLNLQIRFT